MRRTRALLAVALACALAAPAAAEEEQLQDCLDERDPVDFALCAGPAAGRAVGAVEENGVPAFVAARRQADSLLEQLGVCDPTDPAHCLLPFPNDRFTVADPTTDTGRRVALHPLAMPRNVAGKPIDPAEWNRNDGFSPGSPVLTVVPGVDLARTGTAPISDPARSLDPDAPIVLLDAATGERHPYWAELDANPTAGQEPALIVRPAVNFAEATRYVVALRGMRDAAGRPIEPSPAFREQRDAAVRRLAGERPGEGNGKGRGHDPEKVHRDPVFGPLVRAGVDLADLYLAWTFTVASERNLTERALHMRDDAFRSLGDAAPPFTISSVTEAPNSRIARRVAGTFTVPSYLTNGGAPGARLNNAGSRDGVPSRPGGVATQQAPFTCVIPRATGLLSPDPAAVRPARLSLYGHGLLGSGSGEIGAGNIAKMAQENNMVFCATDWIGMSQEDIPAIATMLADMSFFPAIPDRAQQGFLNFLFLARLMKHPQGLGSAPEFRHPVAGSVLDTNDVFYDGNSQGGIMGGALVALSQDVTRAVLGVPGMNYSTLLDRSIDFARYEAVFNDAYPVELERQIVFALIQMLWDRGETNGYAHHVTDDPLPGTPPHQVLLHVAFGDHQVANVSAEVEARTIGAATNPGFLAPGRHWGVEPGWGIPRIGSYPYAGSVIVYWDSGSDTPPDENIPPTRATVRGDPHGDPRATRVARDQKGAFLRTGGTFVDVCGGGPCYARPIWPED